MTKLGIWKLIHHHGNHHHEHTIRRSSRLHEEEEEGSTIAVIKEGGGQNSSKGSDTLCNNNKNKTRSTKYERPKDDDDDDENDESSAHPVPASSEEFTIDDAYGGTTTRSSTTTRTTTKKKKKKKKKHVSFSTVEVRTYEVILGDNPDCSYPLSLGWRYNASSILQQDLDSYEHQHLPCRKTQLEEQINDTVHVGQLLGLIAPTRISDPLMQTSMRPLTLHERRMVLRAQGHSEQQLRQAERKRKIVLSLQWASGHYPKQDDFPYSQRFFLNYVL